MVCRAFSFSVGGVAFPFKCERKCERNVSLPPMVPTFPLFRSYGVAVGECYPMGSGPMLLRGCGQGRHSLFVRMLGRSVHNHVLTITRRQFKRRKCSGASVHRVTKTININIKGVCGCFQGGSRLFYRIIHPILRTVRTVLRRRRNVHNRSIVAVHSRGCLGTYVSRCISLVRARHDLLRVLLFHTRNSSLRRFHRDCASHSAKLIGT